MPNCELVGVQQRQPISKEQDPAAPHVPPYQITCTFRHLETNQAFQHHTDALILATGYAPLPPTFLDGVKDRINYLPNGKFDLSRNYSIAADDTIFVQNADLHSHGFASADLSFGPYRNAVILNTILGYEHFRLEKETSFQQFRPTTG